MQTLMTLEHTTSAVVGASEDAREGIAAFHAQRQPTWPPLSPSIDAMFENDDGADDDL